MRGDELARESALVTALTHADPRCVYASVFFTALLERLENDDAFHPAAAAALKVMDNFDARAALLDAGIFGIDTRAAFDAFGRAERGARAELRAAIRAGLDGTIRSQSGYTLDTLQAALAHAQADNWLGCVEPAVLLGDDSDTVACVVGAICGARGLSVPAHLLPPLRLGHSWAGWEREWACVERFPGLLGG